MCVTFERLYKLDKKSIFTVWRLFKVWKQKLIKFAIKHKVKVFSNPDVFCEL